MEVISVDKLEQAIYDYNHKKYSVSDDDIKRINDIIVKGFVEERRIGHTDAKRFCVDVTLGICNYPLHCTLASFLYGNGEKAETLKNDIDRLINNAGFITRAIPNKGLYIYIKKQNN